MKQLRDHVYIHFLFRYMPSMKINDSLYILKNKLSFLIIKYWNNVRCARLEILQKQEVCIHCSDISPLAKVCPTYDGWAGTRIRSFWL